MDPREIDRTGGLPLEDYGVISDGRTVALVGLDASIDWWCVPAPNEPPVFDRLLDEASGGRFQIVPAEPYRARHRYRPGSNVLETEFITEHGRVRVTDSLNSGHAGRLPRSELARRVEGLEGEVELRVTLTFGGRFGASEPSGAIRPNDGAKQIGPLLVQLRTTDDCAVHEADEVDGSEAPHHNGAAGKDDETADGDEAAHHDGYSVLLRTTAGSRSTLALLVSSRAPLMDSDITKIDERIDRSDEAWRDWSADLSYDGPHQAEVVRSALALKLLLTSPTGAIVAAATTSLPEALTGEGADKTYDYRFAWVRDVAYTVKAFLRVGALEEAQAGFAWLVDTIDRHLPEFEVFYTLDGELPSDQERVDLPGWRGLGEVRDGNDAAGQLQHCVYGDVLETADLFVRCGNHLDARTRDVLVALTDRCCAEWRKPDAGIWELPEPRHHTISKIGAWLCLDRAARLAREGSLPGEYAGRWAAEADEVLAWIDEHAWSAERGAYTQFAGGTELDASLLLATRFGLPRNAELEATRAAIEEELATGPLVHRYSGMAEVEGAFLACSFWMVEALAFLGQPERAADWMDALLPAATNALGVMSEMVDPASGAHLGNLPQGLSHLALIHAALALDEATRSNDSRGGATARDPGHDRAAAQR